ncbi:RraA family protein [Paraburkholderia sartisoli]|uniref:Putative 4-hydroxy-4-methyl-2-oxoglutarate aldolase n=1 Tax=Paraburkholderia sartisoli TaxID=83784 RepID=A0A1H4GRY3_9BURK|nr:hypothetical protein [Paraburkholderia sartisoli]SEB12277.1 Regulator of RNase E activity RraA [Paraburkholderia sartisoli]
MNAQQSAPALGVRTSSDTALSALVARLAKLDTCVVSDALDRLGLRGVAFGLRRLAGTRRFAGRAITVTLGPAEGSTSPRHLCTAAVDMGGVGDVIVIEHHAHQEAAGWGGILSYAANRNGIEGVIVDGMCRDIDEAAELDFQVIGTGAVPATARARVMEIACQDPIVVRGIRVYPGDFVLADRSGVVFLKADHAAEILELAESLAARERQMIERLKNGEPVSMVMGQQYENMLSDNASRNKG